MDKVKLKLGPFVSLDVVVKTATEDEKKDTALTTVCTGKVGGKSHPPVKVNGLMRCSHEQCKREEKSYHPFPRGKDNGDGTFTIPDAADLAAAVVDRALVETITITCCPAADVEGETLPMGRFYWLAPGKTAADSYDTFVRAIREDSEDGWAHVAMYARSSAPATYRIIAHGDLLALQELATPVQLKERPAVNVAAAADANVAMLRTLAQSLRCEFDPANFADTRIAVVAAALARTEAIAGGEAPLATVTQLPTGENMFVAAMRAAGLDPAAVTATPPKKRASRSKKVAAEAPPLQPLPSEVPANVDTTLVAPRKASPRKKTA